MFSKIPKLTLLKYLILIQMCYWPTSILYLTLKGLNDAHCKLFCHRCDPAAIILVACEDFYLFYTISFVLKWHFKYHFRSGNHSQRSSPIACLSTEQSIDQNTKIPFANISCEVHVI